jgi:CheY-like chemotaxis protein
MALKKFIRVMPNDTKPQLNNLAAKQKSVTVLIAEDNEVNMMLIKIMLENIIPDVHLVEACNGLEAADAFLKEDASLVFMDVQMPEMNGYAAATAIRKGETSGRVPIVALTAGSTQGERERCLAAGMDDYITKPIIQDSVKMILEKWLSKTSKVG